MLEIQMTPAQWREMVLSRKTLWFPYHGDLVANSEFCFSFSLNGEIKITNICSGVSLATLNDPYLVRVLATINQRMTKPGRKQKY